jgi:PAS domain S-box-containing protein
MNFPVENTRSTALAPESAASVLSRFGTWEWDFVSGGVTCSDGLWRLFGLQPGSVAPTYELFVGMIHPEDRAALRCWTSAAQAGGPIDWEFRIVRADGVVRWLASRGEIFPDAAGRGGWAAGVLFDVSEIHAARSELAAREERYRALAEMSSVGTWRSDARGEALEAKCWADFTGLAPQDCLGSGWLAAVHPDDVGSVTATWAEARRIVSRSEVRFRARHHSGQFRWVYSRIAPVKNADGTVREWVGTTEDIHAARQVDEALRASEERLRMAVHAGRMVSWDCDLETGFVTRSSNAVEIFGIGSGPADEFLARLHTDDQARIDAALRATLEAGHPFNVEYRLFGPAGEIRWLHASGQLLRSAHKGPDRLAGITFDVTARKEAEIEAERLAQVLRGLEARYRALMEAAGDFVWTAAPDGRVVDMPEWRAFTGQTPEQVQGWGWMNAVHPADRERTRETMQRLIDTRSSQPFEYRLRDRLGAYHWFKARAVPIAAEDGSIREWIGTCTRVRNPTLQRDASNGGTEPIADQPDENPIAAWQVRAARAIVRWSAGELAAASGVSLSTVRRIEEGHGTNVRLLAAVRSTLEQAGVQFRVAADGTRGVSAK